MIKSARHRGCLTRDRKRDRRVILRNHPISKSWRVNGIRQLKVNRASKRRPLLQMRNALTKNFDKNNIKIITKTNNENKIHKP